MKKSILAVAGVAAFAGIAMPVAGAFATDGTLNVTDSISVSIASACSLTQESGPFTGTGATAYNSYSGSLLNDGYIEFTASTTGKNSMNIVCNDTAGWSLKAQAVSALDGTTGQTDLMHSNNSDKIPTGTTFATTGDETTSNWAFKIATSGDGATSATIATDYDSYHALPGTEASVVVSATGEIADVTVTPSYKISANHTQAAGTYTGYVKYTLVHGTN